MASENQQGQADAAAACLKAFFAAPNMFVLPAAASRVTVQSMLDIHAPLLDAIRRYRKGASDYPMMLPFRSAQDNVTTWYACACDKASQRALRDELFAFIGPSYAEFDPMIVGRTPADDILEEHRLFPVRFRAGSVVQEQAVVEKWESYWSLLLRRPPRRALEHRTFPQLRAAFDRAILASNEADARAIIQSLREHHGLSAENRAFLEIRIAAAFERWNDILAHPNFPHLLKVRLPPETFGDIWEALYEVHLRELERMGDVAKLIQAFDAHIRADASQLLRALGRSKRPAALKSFLLYELSQEHPSADLCAQWLDEAGADSFGPATASVRTRIHALTSKSGFEAARENMEYERYEQAYDLLWPLEDAADVLSALLRCAKEIDDPVRAKQIVERVHSSPPAISGVVRDSRVRLLADVTRLAATRPPESLEAQLRIEPEDNVAIENVVELWRERANTDASTEVDEALQTQLLQTMEDEALSNSSTFDALLPIWFDWLIERTQPLARFIPLYRGLIETMQVRDRFGESELELIKQAARHVVMAGPTPEQYRQLMQRLIEIFTLVRSPYVMRWALDLADALVIAPTRSEEARNQLIVAILGAGSEYSTRLADTQKALLLLLARETSIPVALEADETAKNEETGTFVTDARVMLYSLDSQATQRAIEVLKTLSPALKVTSNNDTECTQRLRQQTRHADYVFFVSSAATHQAFYCIKNSLRDPEALCQVPGTGTTRIVESVIRQVRTAQ